MISNSTFYGPQSRIFCDKPELIENYDKAIADTTQIWECHHRMEEYFPRKTLIAIGWYYDCRPDELIFLTKKEHQHLHCSYKDYKNVIEKCRKASSGSNNPMYGTHRKWWNNGEISILSEECPNGFVHGRLKTKLITEESKRKMSEAQKKKMIKCKKAYKKSGRKDWNTFQKDYFKENK